MKTIDVEDAVETGCGCLGMVFVLFVFLSFIKILWRFAW